MRIFLVFVLNVLFCFTIANGQAMANCMKGCGDCGGMGGVQSMKWVDSLGLTKDQMDKVEGIRKELVSSMESTRDGMRKAQMKIPDLMKSDTTDADLLTNFDKMSAEQIAELKKDFVKLLAIKSILNKSQREKASDLIVKALNDNLKRERNRNKK